ncbi:MAG: helix-turn-helix domain-containing protein [Megasphaera elsdenii]|uniref:helix-turn-helix domain-containing protein n=1 Tax=Megasphaera elsdenii TaxID=907 RepID=UPI003D04B4F8|nr:helix-turn-helix domain-containing protein [Megasphaera elsdenii]
MNKERIIPDDADRLLSLDEVAARLKTSSANVARLVRTGLLTTLRFGHYKRVRKVTLNEFLRRYDGQDLLAVLEDREGAEEPCEHVKRF